MADQVRNVYSNRKVFDRISKPIVTPIVSPQQIQDNYFPHCETSLLGDVVSVGIFSYVQVGCPIPHLRGL